MRSTLVLAAALLTLCGAACTEVETSSDELSDFSTTTTVGSAAPYELYVTLSERASEPYVEFSEAELRAAELCQPGEQDTSDWPASDQLLAQAYCPEALSTR